MNNKENLKFQYDRDDKVDHLLKNIDPSSARCYTCKQFVSRDKLRDDVCDECRYRRKMDVPDTAITFYMDHILDAPE